MSVTLAVVVTAFSCSAIGFLVGFWTGYMERSR